MTQSLRRLQEIESMKKSIIEACVQMIHAEGIESISVRKIASMIHYSPSLLYHYYPDKDALIAEVIGSLYLDMNQKLRNVPYHPDSKQLFRNRLETFIKIALSEPTSYLAAMRSKLPQIKSQTDILVKDVLKVKPGFKLMSQSISEISGIVDEDALESLSQIVWISTYGLIDRLIHEQVDIEKATKLINANLDYHLSALEGMNK